MDEAQRAAVIERTGTADRDWVLKQLVRTEAHWTAQRQNQQARVATTMTVAGVMLTLLAGIVFAEHPPGPSWSHRMLATSCVLLAASLVAGVGALMPLDPPREWTGIKPCYFQELGDGAGVHDDVFDSVIKSFPGPGVEDITLRRNLIIMQLALIGVATVVLAVPFGYLAFR